MRSVLLGLAGWHLGVGAGKLLVTALGGPLHFVDAAAALITAAVLFSIAEKLRGGR